MAKMKIYQSEFQAKTQKVLDIGGALSLPYEIAQAQGDAIDKLTSKIIDARDERKETQAQNEARKINKEIDIDLLKKFQSYQFSGNTDDVVKFNDSVVFKNYKTTLKSYKVNKKVKRLGRGNLK